MVQCLVHQSSWVSGWPVCALWPPRKTAQALSDKPCPSHPRPCYNHCSSRPARAAWGGLGQRTASPGKFSLAGYKSPFPSSPLYYLSLENTIRYKPESGSRAIKLYGRSTKCRGGVILLAFQVADVRQWAEGPTTHQGKDISQLSLTALCHPFCSDPFLPLRPFISSVLCYSQTLKFWFEELWFQSHSSWLLGPVGCSGLSQDVLEMQHVF